MLCVFVVLATPSDGKKYEQKDGGLPVDLKLPVKHVLSRELQVLTSLTTYIVLYFFQFAVCLHIFFSCVAFAAIF